MERECSCGDGEARYEFRDTEDDFGRSWVCGDCLIESLINDGVDIPVVMTECKAVAMWKDKDMNDGEVKTETLSGYNVTAGEDGIAVMDGRGIEVTEENEDTLIVIQMEEPQ